MSLIHKKSLYDRHKRNHLGTEVGGKDQEGPDPSKGKYFTDKGMYDSPWSKNRDHMVDLLTQEITSQNTQLDYKPAPKPVTPYQDLDGGTQNFSGQPSFDGADPYHTGTYGTTLKQFGGPYKETGPLDGFY